ncbi:MAG: four helix bundle protein [Patescibacteria group bacterium]|jgi:hypothetical protein
MKQHVRSFTGLISWQEARRLTLSVYQATSLFPKNEIYGLTSQMRRAAVSVCSNIAEGFSRKSRAEKIQFYTIAKSSLTELQNQLIISLDVHYLDKEVFQRISLVSVGCCKLLSGLIRTAENKQ